MFLHRASFQKKKIVLFNYNNYSPNPSSSSFKPHHKINIKWSFIIPQLASKNAHQLQIMVIRDSHSRIPPYQHAPYQSSAPPPPNIPSFFARVQSTRHHQPPLIQLGSFHAEMNSTLAGQIIHLPGASHFPTTSRERLSAASKVQFGHGSYSTYAELPKVASHSVRQVREKFPLEKKYQIAFYLDGRRGANDR